MQDRKYSYAVVKIYLAFINENIFTNKSLVSNVWVVVVRETRNMTNGKTERKRERLKERRNEGKRKKEGKKGERVKKPHLPFPKITWMLIQIPQPSFHSL